jgi:uncharacterized caspase-like protein
MIDIRQLVLALAMVMTALSAAMAAGGDADPAAPGRRVALVLGNAAYENVPPLLHSVDDAKAIAAELEDLDFEVIAGYDLTKLETQETIARFAREVRGADIALFFYAGHGMQVAGNNYLLPVDAALHDETSLDFETVQINFILRQMSRETGLRLIFLDACRDNPLAKAFGENSDTGGVSSGLAEIQVAKGGKGTLIAFATSPNEVAYDGAGEHSPFTTALLTHLGEQNQSLTAAMTKVTGDVVKATNGLQQPWVNLSLTDDVILNPAAPAAPPTGTAVASNTGDADSTSPGAGSETRTPGAEARFTAYTTSYTWYDNSPPGSSEIAFPKSDGFPTVHDLAGGDGTYDDPITIAVGHVMADGKSTPDFAPGTRFYIPNIRKYFIVEDVCGEGSEPQNGPCHKLDPEAEATGATIWLDMWIDGQSATNEQAKSCSAHLTEGFVVIENPAPNYVVVPGAVLSDGHCAEQFGDDVATK